jgi:hypothetical protein
MLVFICLIMRNFASNVCKMSEKEKNIRLTVSLPPKYYYELVQLSNGNDDSKDKTARNLIIQALKERQRQRKKNAKEGDAANNPADMG